MSELMDGDIHFLDIHLAEFSIWWCCYNNDIDIMAPLYFEHTLHHFSITLVSRPNNVRHFLLATMHI